MRASRLLSIMILLQLRGKIAAEALAAEFEVSVRTIYRDIDELSAAGIPVQSDRGPHGGFQLMAGYRSQFTGLENDEAEALFMIGLPGPAIALGLGNAATRASRKLLASLPPSLREGSRRIADCFHLDTNDWYRNEQSTIELPRIARAVLAQQKLQTSYQSWSGLRQWQMEPLGLVLKAGAWYLVANSQSRASSPKKIRIFKVVHITDMQVQDENFDRPDDFDLPDFWNEATARFEAELRSNNAHLRVSATGLDRIAKLGAFAAQAVENQRDTSNTPESDAPWQTINLPIETIEHAAQMLLGIGPELEVIEPLALRQRLRELAWQCYQLNGDAACQE